MAAVCNGSPKRKYSWWWDSHITPKNSKWLQENLTDMDDKVKQMIRLIEEDADSFARRAEMYYKKRPELMKLVEELYRAYRALAERYDYATGVIRQAQTTMAEVCPNQVPLMFGDESPAVVSINQADPRTPDTRPIQHVVDPDKFHRDALGFSSSHEHAVKRNAVFYEGSQSVSSRKGLKRLNDMFGSETETARKGGRNDGSNTSHDLLEPQFGSESEQISKFEAEIVALEDALSKLQAEKEATLTQCKLNSEKLSNLESEISRAQEDSKGLNERAMKAESEVQRLKDTLEKLESEKESSLLQYQQCQQRVADLETSLSLAQKDAGESNERARKAESETQTLKQNLSRAEADKEAAFVIYWQCLKTLSNLEETLQKAEGDARFITERAEKAEAEVENLKQTISRLVQDKEASELQYRMCLDKIAELKLKLFNAQEETQRLTREVEDGVTKLKFSEEKCGVLERSNHTLHSDLDTLLEKLDNKNQQLTEKQKETGRLWTCVQEERLRFLEADVAFQSLHQMHAQSQEELKTLAFELQLRSQISKDMEGRNHDLQKEVEKAQLEKKVLNELNLTSSASVDGLREEVSSLRETIKKLEAELQLRVDERNALQQELCCLKEELRQMGKKHQSMMEQVELLGLHPDSFGSSVKELQDENSKLKERETTEKMALLEKSEMMEQLVQKNLHLENSISDLNSELEAARGKLSGLIDEKDRLISQLQDATENSKMKSLALETEREASLKRIEELRVSLDAKAREYASFVEFSEARMGEMASKIHHELDRSVDAQIEIFVMQKCLGDLLEKNSCLMVENQRMEEESTANGAQVDSLISQVEALRMGLHQVSKRLEVFPEIESEDENIRDQKYVQGIMSKIDEMETILLKIQEENQLSAIENLVVVTLRHQLEEEAVGISTKKSISWEELEHRNALKDDEIEQLKERIKSLEDANKEQKAQMENCSRDAILLDESIRSLERRITTMHFQCDDELMKGTGSGAANMEDELPELHDMRLRVKAIEETVMQKEKLVTQANSDAYSKLESAIMRRIDDLNSDSRRSKRRQEGDRRSQKHIHKLSAEESEMIMKDIVLDHVSDFTSYGINRRGTLEADDQEIEMWEINGSDSSFDLKLQKPYKAAAKGKGKSMSEESLVVDKLEIYDRFTDPNQLVQKRKVLEKLDSDLKKLEMLQITVQDLRSKFDIGEKVGKGKGEEYETIQRQLEEVDEALVRLFNVNQKLMNKLKNGFVGSDGNRSTDSEGKESTLRRRIRAHMRKGSEKIARLGLEIRKIQSMLMRSEGERVKDIQRRVMLRDYIYGGARNVQMKKKKRSMFCGCVQPQSP